MPVNMDPKKRSRKTEPQEPAANPDSKTGETGQVCKKPDEEAERDREMELAEKEWKHLWDATEVIDMDRW